jgi:hypothetical protein
MIVAGGSNCLRLWSPLDLSHEITASKSNGRYDGDRLVQIPPHRSDKPRAEHSILLEVQGQEPSQPQVAKLLHDPLQHGRLAIAGGTSQQY